MVHDDIVHYGILKKGEISKAGKFTAKIDINRKMLADLAVNDEKAFRTLTEKAKIALEKP